MGGCRPLDNLAQVSHHDYTRHRTYTHRGSGCRPRLQSRVAWFDSRVVCGTVAPAAIVASIGVLAIASSGYNVNSSAKYP